MELPTEPHNVGKICKAKYPDGSIRRFTIEDELHIPKTGSETKLIYLQKIRLDDKRVELRLGYYVIGVKGNMCGKWVWGQYAALFPPEDLKKLFDMAKQKQWL